MQVRLPAAILVLVPHPTDYLARRDRLADSFTYNRDRIEVPLEGPERNVAEQVLGNHHITVIAVGGIVAEV